VLRRALRAAGAGWAAAVVGVAPTPPPRGGDDREAVARLAAEGPPDEDVGLDAYPGPQPVTIGARP
jgi:nitrate reductase delta subunit